MQAQYILSSENPGLISQILNLKQKVTAESGCTSAFLSEQQLNRDARIWAINYRLRDMNWNDKNWHLTLNVGTFSK